MDGHLEASERGFKKANNDLEMNLLAADMSAQTLVECTNIAAGSTENLPQVINTDMRLAKSQTNIGETEYMDNLQIMDQTNVDTGPVCKGNVEDTRKRSEENINKNVVHTRDMSKLPLADGQETGAECIKDKDDEKTVSSDVKEDEGLSTDLGQYPRTKPVASVKRKLLVLDVNGLLADIVMPAPKDRRGNIHILGRAIFKRPFCDDFLNFCFDNFDVAIWKIIDKVVDYLLGNLKDKLLFCWDMAHSTQTGFKTLENIHKPLVCKELKKIWEIDDPSSSWKAGDYDELNTLLLDDSPYKALLNPRHTAIFPNSYHYHDKDDNSLGPGGDLRVYLEGLLASDNVQSYVKQHPYGQSAIGETSLFWKFYSEVLQTMSNQMQENDLRVVSNLSSK